VSPSYERWTFRTGSENEDLLVAELWALGTVGVESRPSGDQVCVEAYFVCRAEGEAGSAAAAVEWAALGVEWVAATAVPPTDWLAEYRRQAAPFDLGRGFRVDPSDGSDRPALPSGERTARPSLSRPHGGRGTPAPALDPGSEARPWAIRSRRGRGGSPTRRLLRIPARTAFGTGTHATTRLAVELLEAAPPAGSDVLDLGAGSGILSMVALSLGARRAVGLEIDVAAALVAEVNRRNNELPVAFVAGELACLRAGCPFDRLIVNMTLGNLEPCLLPLGRVLVPGCRAIFSGALVEQRAALETALESAGFALGDADREEEGWIALTAQFRPR
jgi:ribosomal protein L11 methylase PrmA